jgi:hypothetical protein
MEGKRVEIAKDDRRGEWRARRGRRVIDEAPTFRDVIGSLRQRARSQQGD